MKKAFKILACLIFVAMFITVLTSYAIHLYKDGLLHINYPSEKKYPIRGVDVSSYQGEINWETIKKQNIQFAFIKSTEGSTYVDSRFAHNWNCATKAGIRAGAYHFFSFDSSGESQAENFCKTVSYKEDMLPPVIDVEYYGKYQKESDINIPKAKKELRILVDILEKEYGMKPIIYSGFLYEAIIEEDFEDCDLWFGLMFDPFFDIKGKSVFWQYSQNHILKGYSGAEKFIDMNVFWGTKEEFESYPNK